MPPVAEPRATSSSVEPPFGLGFTMAVFERASRLARSMFAAAGASIILVRDGKVWRSRYADILPSEDPVTESVLKGGKLFWIEDGQADPRFADHPLVTGPPFLRFTVAVPIRLQDGSTPGVLSVSGPNPEPFDAGKTARLQDIADFVADEWVRTHTQAALAQSLRDRDLALDRSERSEERLKLALALADIHVWELDYAKRKLVKAGAEDTFFAQPMTYADLQADLHAVVDPRDRPAVQAAWRDHLQNGAAYRPEHRVNRPDGREVWVQSAVKVFRDGSGRPVRIVGALQNITARKIAERALLDAKEEAVAASKAKSSFLATMSHELRTPLNAILGFSEIIKDGILGPSPDRYADYAADIYASGRHLLDLVNDVLDIAKLEAGRVELHETLLDIQDLVTDAAATLGKQAETAQVAVERQFTPLPRVRADERLLKQVLLNLLSNALKFTPAGGTVTLATRRIPANGLEIVVADTGIGMSPPEIATALTPFGQVDSNVARKSRGTGLGLPISVSLMKLHGGHLQVDSEPARGTRVTMALPEARVLPESALFAAS